MQEESAESLHSNVFVWPCPLCQQGRTDRDALALHLTDKHSVLPACLERLLDTATPEQRAVSGVVEGETDTQNKETDGAASDSETDTNTATPTQSTANRVLRGSRGKAVPRAEREGEGEREREPEGKESLNPDQERILHPESTKSRKGTARTAVSGDSSSDASSVTKSTSTGKATSDPALEKFLDPNRPFKCNACLESFPSKSALGVHYSSTSHLHRMRTGSAKQGDESDTSSVPITPAPHPTRPFISNKPYQCAVCRVSYNHAFTLESHMKSVLHQTRSRNAVNLAGTSDKKGVGNSGNATTGTSAVNTAFGNSAPNSLTSCVVSASNSVGVNTSCSGIQRSIGAKDTELNQSQSVSSSCPPSAPPLSLLSSSATSTQAVSAFLTLLTSSSQPSLFAANAGATAPQLELIARQQLLLPLFLNGLQTQSQNSNLESSNAVLTQSVPLLGLSAAQQAVLAQRLDCLQNPSSGTAAHTCAEDGAPKLKPEVGEEESCPGNGEKMLGDGLLMLESETEEKGTMGHVTVKKELSELDGTLESEDVVVNKDQGEEAKEKRAEGNDFVEKLECVEEREELGDESTTSCDAGDQLHCATSDTILSLGDNAHSAAPSPRVSPNPSHNSKSCSPTVNPNSCLPTPTAAGLKCPNPSSDRPVLTEFQSQVLWAFLESRCEADAASPPREDCEALGREVGLSEEEVRRWLGDARETRERQKGDAAKTVLKKMEGDRTDIEETEGGESPAVSCHAIDLSNNGERGRDREYGRESPGESCLTSDSDNDGFYTSVIVTDEESQNSSFQEEAPSPVREEVQSEEKAIGGGKVLRSSTVFLSDAEDTEDEEEGGPQRVKRRKRKREVEEVEVKKERPDPDVDLELEAQTESPPSALSLEPQSLPGVLHPLPLSLSLAPFATQFLNPYVLSLPSSTVGLGIAEGDGDRDRGRAPVFQNPPAITRCSAPFLDALKTPPPASHMSPARSLSNGGVCESALDLSMGKKHSATSAASSSSSTGNKTGVQRDRKLDGLELRSTALGVPAAGGLIVVRVKPDSALAVPNPNSGIHSNNNAKTSTVYIRAAERVNASMMEKEKGADGEAESQKQQKHPKARRYRDMRRSRTIIQTEQLDVLYGCYFKDPNPGKHEFERISEWVHLPKKVVQIWFQNMRARERKGEVRFISDGTLAAVGKPLIKFTWPLTLPIFTSSPNQKTSSLSSSGIAKVSAEASTGSVSAKSKPDKQQVKEEKESKPKEVGVASSVAHLSVPKVSKPKPETLNQAAASKTLSKCVTAAPTVPVVMKTRSAPLSHQSQKRRRGTEERCGGEEEKTDDEDEEQGKEKIGPGTTNRMVPKISSTSASKSLTPSSQKRNGLNDWSPKGPIKISALSREQLGLSSAQPPVITTIPVSTPTNANIIAKPTPQDGACLHHSTPRRPRTHLTSLQVSIMQSCYETCPHPNALECEKMGAELGLPLKVVQIWFQNTRAKEKRWRLQLQKQSASSTDSSKKVDTSSGSFLLYNALRANRPILPKPVQLTVMEPSAPPGVGQPAGRETLRGRCDACGVEFESREAGRTHVFSPQHLATLRSTNFGQPPSLVNKGSGAGSSLSSGAAVQSSPSPASSTS